MINDIDERKKQLTTMMCFDFIVMKLYFLVVHGACIYKQYGNNLQSSCFPAPLRQLNRSRRGVDCSFTCLMCHVSYAIHHSFSCAMCVWYVPVVWYPYKTIVYLYGYCFMLCEFPMVFFKRSLSKRLSLKRLKRSIVQHIFM
jgi:hypothetical protein